MRSCHAVAAGIIVVLAHVFVRGVRVGADQGAGAERPDAAVEQGHPADQS